MCFFVVYCLQFFTLISAYLNPPEIPTTLQKPNQNKKTHTKNPNKNLQKLFQNLRDTVEEAVCSCSLSFSTHGTEDLQQMLPHSAFLRWVSSEVLQMGILSHGWFE